MKNIKNEYVIDGDIVKIQIKRRSGEQFEVLIDLDDYDKARALNVSWFVKWNGHSKFYYCSANQSYWDENGKRKQRTIQLHRIIMGSKDFAEKPDHINHNTLDNRKSNLKVKSNSENLTNRRGCNSNNKTSGHRNVSLFNNQWYVQLVVDGKNKLLGKFPYEQLDKAVEFAEQKRKEVYGDAGR